jgi:RNA polymerase sigma-70 factor (ECF subfamily)
MEEPPRVDAPSLLEDCRQGDAQALSRLVPLVYKELRGLANTYMRGERDGHSLSPTELVHEACVRLIGVEISWDNRRHFFRVAAQSMRRILIDHARAKNSSKRDAGIARITLDEERVQDEGRPLNLLALDSALDALDRKNTRQRQIVELHFFVGLSHVEVSRVLDISPATVDRDMRFAKAWLRSAMDQDNADGH